MEEWPIRIATIADVHDAQEVFRQHISPTPLIRSYRLEKELGLPGSRRVWLKDYGWTPVGSFKLLGALNWQGMASGCGWVAGVESRERVSSPQIVCWGLAALDPSHPKIKT